MILVSYCIFLRKRKADSLSDDPYFLLHFLKKRRADSLSDDACHQISYEARLGGISMGRIGAKRAKMGLRKKIFFGKVS